MRPNGLLANFFLHFKGTTSGDECFYFLNEHLMVFTIFGFFVNEITTVIMKILPVTLFGELVPAF